MLEVNATAFIFALSFLLFVFILNEVLWKPLFAVKTVRQREKTGKEHAADMINSKTRNIIKGINQNLEAHRSKFSEAMQQLLTDAKQLEDKEKQELLSSFSLEKSSELNKLEADLQELPRLLEPQVGILADELENRLFRELLAHK